MKKLQKWKNLLQKINREDIETELSKRGFKKISYRDIFMNKSERIVIKQSYLVGETPPDSIKIPTLTHKRWFIQPIAITNKKKQVAKKIILSKYPKATDLHSGNYGWYRNKPVVFDW